MSGDNVTPIRPTDGKDGLKAIADRLYGAIALVATSRGAVDAIDRDVEVDVVYVRTTLERAVEELEAIHSELERP